MRNWWTLIAVFLIHLLLSVVSVSQLISCGVGGCGYGKIILNKMLEFPLFLAIELFDRLLGGGEWSGENLLVLMLVNSLMFVVVAYFLLFFLRLQRGKDNG